MEAIIDKFGRIVIPRSVREHLGLKPGMILEVEEQNKDVILKPLKQHLVKKKGDVLVYTGKAIGNLDEVIGNLRKERIKKQGSFK